jgi:dihydroorotate dehydrogenase electron transfer subunit
MSSVVQPGGAGDTATQGPALFTGGILENRRVAEGLLRLELAVPASGAAPEPGQFVSLVLEPPGEPSAGPVLRRPFSVAGYVAAAGRRRLTLLYAPVGQVTRRLAALPPGATIGLLGPLGTAFPLSAPEPILLVGGGRGIAPLLFLGAELARRERGFAVAYGTRRGAEMLPSAELPGGSIWLATEDGSRGHDGTVFKALEALSTTPRSVMACGPHAMLAAIARWAAARGAACWVSVEAIFGCGTGLCGGCAIPAAQERRGFLWACRQGPVLSAEEVDWERWERCGL